MKLFRVVGKTELLNMLNENTEKLGTCMDSIKTPFNTHKYEQGKKYLHFFYNKTACQHILQLISEKNKPSNVGVIRNCYIITVNIPLSKIINTTAHGYYIPIGETNSGYDYGIKKRLEAIIDANEFDKSWIKKIEQAKINRRIINCNLEK